MVFQQKIDEEREFRKPELGYDQRDFLSRERRLPPLLYWIVF